jgi:hypothetical protein
MLRFGVQLVVKNVVLLFTETYLISHIYTSIIYQP